MEAQAKPRPLFEPVNPNDLSTQLHRQLVGYVAFFFPWIVLLVDWMRPTPALIESPKSISAYYYTGAVAFFVGSLFAVSAFLFTYRGFKDEYGRRTDMIFGWLAGIAALVVAFFPTYPPRDVTPPTWWAEWMSVLHHYGAGALFVVLAIISAFLFTKKSKENQANTATGKIVRNGLHYICAGVMVFCIVWALYSAWKGGSIFWPEAVALMAFGISWLVKGRVDSTAVAIWSDPLVVPKEIWKAARGEKAAMNQK